MKQVKQAKVKLFGGILPVVGLSVSPVVEATP
jgi:hypothetical protein